MRQVLFWIPLKPFSWLPGSWPDWSIPVYGFGVMLCLALLVCTWLGAWRARREGVAPQLLQDLAVWIFVGGIIGARIVYMIQYHEPLQRFFFIWQGGLVFYGSAIGGFIGYLLAYWLVVRSRGVSTWQLADIIAPCAAIGLCLGRVGCLLNGCCYGNVACAHGPEVTFPLSSPARYSLVERGLQTAAGFTLSDGDDDDPRKVREVADGSPSDRAGLKPGDVIVQVNGRDIARDVWLVVEEKGSHVEHDYPSWREARAARARFEREGRTVERVSDDVSGHFTGGWPRGRTDLELTVRRGGEELTLGPIFPRTLGLHPTQVYESISMVFLFLLLMAYYPFRRHYGEVMVLFILGYSVHRFLNEMLRNDTDPVAFNMTLSQNGSILFFALGLGLAFWLARQPPLPAPEPVRRESKVPVLEG